MLRYFVGLDKSKQMSNSHNWQILDDIERLNKGHLIQLFVFQLAVNQA